MLIWGTFLPRWEDKLDSDVCAKCSSLLSCHKALLAACTVKNKSTSSHSANEPLLVLSSLRGRTSLLEISYHHLFLAQAPWRPTVLFPTYSLTHSICSVVKRESNLLCTCVLPALNCVVALICILLWIIVFAKWKTKLYKCRCKDCKQSLGLQIVWHIHP